VLENVELKCTVKQYEDYSVAYCDIFRDCGSATVDALYERLSQFLKDKIDAHRFSNNRRRSILAYSLLAQLLGHYPDDFIYNPHGKPSLVEGVQFSVSHSKRHVAAVVSNNSIGVDIETLRDVSKFSFETILSTKELMQVQSSRYEPEVEFWKLWTRKEAYLKCLGTGINSDLREVEVIDDDLADCKLTTEVFAEFVISVCVSK
jgi:4'-phosphopantetheinyl transferase